MTFKSKNRVCAIIPARGGSKGVPHKNIKPIAGKPLIAWSIEHALNSELVDRIIVSTDCEKIAETARKYGAEVPFLRPKNISGDSATTESALIHCCEYLRNIQEMPDAILLIQCTSPIREIGVFDNAIRKFFVEQLDSLLSVSLSHRFTWKNPEQPTASYDFMNRPRRQDIKEEDQEFLETGSFYLTRTNKLIETKNRLCGKIGMYITSEIESYEIDSIADFVVCEELMKLRN
jgi:CMP-N,N'-diacetyllegionaminic acid synthase